MNRLLAGVASLLGICSAAQAQSTLQLLDAGAAPRAPLRYQFQVGRTELAMMEMTMKMVSEEGGKQTQVAVMPAVRSNMRLRVTEVAADGSARLEFETTSAEAPVGQAAGAGVETAVQDSLAMLSQLKGWYRTDTQGRMLQTSVSLPDGAMPAGSKALMDEMMNSGDESLEPFPEEAVGIGARWQTSQTTELAGTKMTQTFEYTLRSRSGNRVALDIKIINPPAAGSSPVAGLGLNSTTTGGGTMVIDLQGLTPVLNLEINSTTTMPAMPQSEAAPRKMMMQMKMTSGLANN